MGGGKKTGEGEYELKAYVQVAPDGWNSDSKLRYSESRNSGKCYVYSTL
jgi:hypothetical protein